MPELGLAETEGISWEKGGEQLSNGRCSHLMNPHGHEKHSKVKNFQALIIPRWVRAEAAWQVEGVNRDKILKS